MGNQFTVVAGRMFEAESHDQAGHLEDEVSLAQAAAEELLLMGLPRVNVLLAGTDDEVARVLQVLLEKVEQPIATWSPGEPFVLPSIDATRTFVIHELSALCLHDQIELLGWSGSAMGNTQVISTTSVPLIPRISGGAFIDTLYYRLNTVYVDVGESES